MERTNKETHRRSRRNRATRRRRGTRPSSRQSIQGTRPDSQSGQASRTRRRSHPSGLESPETLTAAFEGAHGVFLVTNFREEGTDEAEQATAAVRAAKDKGVKHFVWSTLPDVEAISGGKFHVPAFYRQGQG
jgi:NmrA-like family.